MRADLRGCGNLLLRLAAFVFAPGSDTTTAQLFSMLYNCHTCFSLRYGTLDVDALLDLAEEQGHDCLALTDINNTSAGLEFVMKARARGLRPVLGIEFREGNRLRYIGLARSAAGWRALCGYLSEALHAAATGGELPADLSGAAAGLAPGAAQQVKEAVTQRFGKDAARAGLGGPGAALGKSAVAAALPAGERRLRFHPRAPILPDVSWVYPLGGAPGPADLREEEFVGVRPVELNRLYSSPYKSFREKLLSLTPVTFRDKIGFNTHRLLRAIDRNTILSKQEPWDVAAADETMYSTAQILQHYQGHAHLVTNTLRLLDRCSFEMTFEQHKNRRFYTGSRYDDRLLLEKLAWDGVRYRYGRASEEVRERVEKELGIIDRLGFSAYFLITWDFVRYGQSRGFFHVGRGSGANSIVAFCMGITDVDPIELNLYFERFLNPHRTSPPDFDIDFSWKDRDEVIDYVFKRYGHSHTSLMATYNTFKDRSIIRELAKVFGLPKEEIDSLVAQRRDPRIDDQVVRLIYRYGRELSGLPNHLGIHPGGILISEEPIRSFSATDLPPKGFPIVQFDMFVAEDAGLYKYDVLSQRGLGHIKSSAEIVRENAGRTVDVHEVAAFKADPKIAELLRKGDTIGCFYVESPAMRQLLRKLGCDNYLTLVAASSVIRPGVARSGMMRQFIERHCASVAQGEDVDDSDWYMHPRMGEILAETYGVMVYQEDVIKVAHHFGGVELGEADVLRRAMSGKYRSRNHFDIIRETFHNNCRDLGYDEGMTAEVWRQMESFSGYSFCKAHSASFAVESYQSLFFKAHYPREFMVGVLNNFGGFYRAEVYLHEARRGGAQIEAPCVNGGSYLSTIRGETIWLGMVHVQGLEQKISVAIEVERRRGGPYRDVDDLLRRVPMGLEQLSLLVRVGALRFTGRSKKRLLWEANLKFAKEVQAVQKSELFAASGKEWALPNLPDDWVEDAYDELELLGFVLQGRSKDSLRPGIFDLLAHPPGPGEVVAADFGRLVGRRVTLTGYLICTKRVRTVKGDMMGFGDFIDQCGDYFDVVMFPDVYGQSGPAGRGLYQMSGKLVDDFGVVALEVERMARCGYLGDPRRD